MCLSLEREKERETSLPFFTPFRESELFHAMRSFHDATYRDRGRISGNERPCEPPPKRRSIIVDFHCFPGRLSVHGDTTGRNKIGSRLKEASGETSIGSNRFRFVLETPLRGRVKTLIIVTKPSIGRGEKHDDNGRFLLKNRLDQITGQFPLTRSSSFSLLITFHSHISDEIKL